MTTATAITIPTAPTDTLTVQHFAVTAVRVDPPEAGEISIEPLLISVDPYLLMPIRGATFPDGRIRSRLIARVLQSQTPGLAAGDLVLGFARWQDRDTVRGADMRLLNPVIPLPAYLGIAGHSGFTAMLGIAILDPQPGQTVTISSAAGMVGMVAAQLAKAAGAQVVAIAGGEKAQAVARLFDLAGSVDHGDPALARRIAENCPNGVDRHFENVGAKILDPVLDLANRRARIAFCGLIEHYGDDAPVCLTHFRQILLKTVTITPFSIYDHEDLYPAALTRLEGMVREGRLHAPETIHHGIAALPGAFMAMLNGDGIGKHLVAVAA